MSGAFVSESDCGGLFSFASLFNAYMACRRRKRNTSNALRFEINVLDNIFSLGDELVKGGYKPSRSVCFVTGKPKLREIFAADFRDRVVHHLLVSRMEDIYEPKFIYDSYACRRSKGTHAAVKRLRYFMNSVSRRGARPAWFLQLDIRSFFMSIDKTILMEIIERNVKDKTILALARKVIFHDCTDEYIYKGNSDLLNRVPSQKSLFHAAPATGLPIGNLTSQFFANLYLNELDQFMKHTIKAKYYLRYVDDFIILQSSRETLLDMKETVGDFLRQKLKLDLKPGYSLKQVNEGADFLGYIIRPGYLLARNRVVGNLKGRLHDFCGRIAVKGAVGKNSYTILHLREKTVKELRQVLSSYLGHFLHANTYNLMRSVFEKNSWLKYIFSLHGYRLVPLYEPAFTPRNLKEQYSWFVKKYGDYCILFQVGKFIELYGSQADKYAPVLNLVMSDGTRNIGKQAGFPIKMLKSVKRRLLRLRLPYIVAAEIGYYRSPLKQRVVTEMFLFKGETV